MKYKFNMPYLFKKLSYTYDKPVNGGVVHIKFGKNTYQINIVNPFLIQDEVMSYVRSLPV